VRSTPTVALTGLAIIIALKHIVRCSSTSL